MRKLLLAVGILLGSIASANAQLAVGFSSPGISIGINVPAYPYLVPVPGYPVYYAPQLGANYFFYDGLYWVYEGDNWYASSWYNGPWQLVAPEVVPAFILRVPVRYYYRPPPYFRGWRVDAPPRWGEHWGAVWARHRYGWDRWNRASAPRPAPLPVYQRQYAGNRYPHTEQQYALQSRNYRYQPQDAVVRQHFAARRAQEAPAATPRPTERGPGSPGAYPNPRAQNAVPSPRMTPPAEPRVAQPPERAPVVTGRVQRQVPQERNVTRQESRGPGQASSVAQGQAPAPQRALPPQREAREAQQIAANASRPMVSERQAPPPQSQRAEAPRAPDARAQEKRREKDEQHGADHNK